MTGYEVQHYTITAETKVRVVIHDTKVVVLNEHDLVIGLIMRVDDRFVVTNHQGGIFDWYESEELDRAVRDLVYLQSQPAAWITRDMEKTSP